MKKSQSFCDVVWTDEAQERAAILEYDAYMSRAEAERLALIWESQPYYIEKLSGKSK